MKVFKMSADSENFKSMRLKTIDKEIIRFFEGKKIDESWPNITFDWIDLSDDSDTTLKATKFQIGDISYDFATCTLAFSQSAYKKTYEILKKYGVFYPITHNESDLKYYLYSVTNLIDSLDWNNADVKRSKINNRIMRVKKYAFDKHKLSHNLCFKIEDKYSIIPDIFITEELVDIFNDLQISGFDNVLKWEG